MEHIKHIKHIKTASILHLLWYVLTVSTIQASCTWPNKRVCSVFDLLTAVYLGFPFFFFGGGLLILEH